MCMCLSMSHFVFIVVSKSRGPISLKVGPRFRFLMPTRLPSSLTKYVPCTQILYGKTPPPPPLFFSPFFFFFFFFSFIAFVRDGHLFVFSKRAVFAKIRTLSCVPLRRSFCNLLCVVFFFFFWGGSSKAMKFVFWIVTFGFWPYW